MFEAKCHCGDVTLSVKTLPKTVTRCNCSICHRLGTLWAYYTTAEVAVVSESEGTDLYVWGDRCIEFHRCKTCGCLTHYTGTPDSELDRIAINFRMMPRDILKPIPVRKFDGADTWTFIED